MGELFSQKVGPVEMYIVNAVPASSQKERYIQFLIPFRYFMTVTLNSVIPPLFWTKTGRKIYIIYMCGFI